jgi:hypothetical protein
MKAQGTRLATLAAALALLASGPLAWADVSARLGRDRVAFGEPLTLTIRSDGKDSGAQPDLAPLRKDFDVLGTSRSSEVRIINFHRSDSVRWTVQLMPRRAGSIEVPPIAVGAEQTAALALEVGGPAAAPSAGAAAQAPGTLAFIEVDAAAAKRPVYVQQQLPLTVRLYVDGSVQSGDLRGPSSPDAVVEQLGDEHRSSETVNGHDYTVIERRYAISPEKSGTLRIEAPSFRGQAVVPAAPGSDPGDDMMAEMLRNTPFANNPIFRNRMFGGTGASLRPVGASGEALTLDVRPRPAAAQGAWLPAEQIGIHDSWADAAPHFKAGEPVTRTLTIQARGLAAAQIPPLAPAAPANARVYPDAPDNQSRTDGTTIFGTSRQTLTYIPNAEGALEIPGVDLAWWDTKDDVQRHAELPARSFRVAPGAVPATAGATPAPVSTGAPAATGRPTPGVAATPQGATWQARAFEWLRDHRAALAAGLAVLLAGALTRWLLRRRAAPAAAPAGRAAQAPARRAAQAPARRAAQPPATGAGRRALQQACRSGEREAAARALLDLARAQWPEHAPRGLGELADRLAAGGDEVRALDRSLYGSTAEPWDGTALWQALGRGLRDRAKTQGAPQRDTLAPLYP